MQTRLAPEFSGSAAAAEAAAIVGRCVHCGFCTATCPTYQVLGDELDGPRGRIHLMQQMLEGQAVSGATRLHLDRCLGCRACETTCPSGVEYGHLLDFGRNLVEQKVPRSTSARMLRRLLAAFLTGPLFAPVLRLGQVLRPVLPQRLRGRVPRPLPRGEWPVVRHPRKMLLLGGCVHDALSPGIHSAAARVFDRLGITLQRIPAAGCCGAIRHHLADAEGALRDMRRNVDAWWPHVEGGAEAIVSLASGCGSMLRDYGHLLRGDPAYAARAARISELARDPAELLPAHGSRLRELSSGAPAMKVAFHSPCSLQHGLKLRGTVEGLLKQLGADLVGVADSPQCCGSAGTYSLLQPELSTTLGQAKAAALSLAHPQYILSANVGCIVQLGAFTDVPVMHWIEWVDARITAA
ncbi:MAG TPA: glycolate oxidase subunit GlcF [Steroidobacteraceae bacterium]|nr:glycolate oxidase subunit GlcF [Steroidobacteraceae bacterium]